MQQNLEIQKESLNPPADSQDLELRLVYIGDIGFEIGETSLAGDTPRGGGGFLVPITGGICLQRHMKIVPLQLTFSSSLQVIYLHPVPLPKGVGIRSNATKGLRVKILQGGSDYPLVYKNQLAEINVNTVA